MIHVTDKGVSILFRAKELREAVSAPLAKYFVEQLSDLIKDSKSTIFTTCVINSLDSKVSSVLRDFSRDPTRIASMIPS